MNVDVEKMIGADARSFVDSLVRDKGFENYKKILVNEISDRKAYLEDLIKEIAIKKIEIKIFEDELKKIEE